MKSRFFITTLTLSVLFILLSTLVPHVYAQTPQCANDDYACIAAQQAQSTPAPSTNLGGGNPTPTTNLPGGNPGTAQTAPSGVTMLVNPLNNINSLPDLLKAVLAAMVQLGTVVLVVALVWVGFSFVRAQGNPEALKKARSALVWTIIGGAILLGAQALSTVIQSTVSNL